MEQAVKTKKYYNEINLIRGFAALMIVFAHSTPFDDFAMPEKLSFISHSLMSVFYMISGFVNARKFCSNSDFKKNAVKQVRRLFVPYFIYSAIAYFLKYFTNRLEGMSFWGIFTGESPCIILWFVWVLFVASEISYLIAFCLSKAKIKNRENVLLGIGIAAYIPIVFFDLGILGEVLVCLTYSYAGIFIRKHYDTYKKVIKNKIAAVILCLLLVTLYTIMDEHSLLIHLVTIPFIWLVFSVVADNFKDSIIYKFFDNLGTHSFEIYLWSYFVQIAARVVCVSILQLNDILSFALIFICGLTIPYAMSVITKRYNIILR